MPRNTYEPLAGNNAIVDYSTLISGNGTAIDWDLVPESYRAGVETVKLAAAAAIGDDELTVDALPIPLSLGQVLNFGELDDVLVTVNDASISAGDTSFTVVALPGPIPAGAVLNFGGGTNAQVAVTSADHAEGETTLNVEKLDGTIANSSTATFHGGTKLARVTEAVAAGETTVAVDELQFGIADDSEALVMQSGRTGAKKIPALTPMAKLSSGKRIPRALVTGAETADCLLLTNAEEDGQNFGYSGYGTIVGGVLYENLMPGATGSPAVINSTYKTELATNKCYFRFEQYYDSRITEAE